MIQAKQYHSDTIEQSKIDHDTRSHTMNKSLGIYHVNALGIFNILNEVVEEYKIKWHNVISTCVDGATIIIENTTGVSDKI